MPSGAKANAQTWTPGVLIRPFPCWLKGTTSPRVDRGWLANAGSLVEHSPSDCGLCRFRYEFVPCLRRLREPSRRDKPEDAGDEASSRRDQDGRPEPADNRGHLNSQGQEPGHGAAKAGTLHQSSDQVLELLGRSENLPARQAADVDESLG